MGKLIFGGLLLLIAFFLMLARSGSTTAGRPVAGLLRIFSLAFATFGILIILAALVVVVDPGQVGVKHAFGTVDPQPLLPGIHMVAPWSSIERYSAREEQYPAEGEQVETIAALSSEQMGMTVDAGSAGRSTPRRPEDLQRDRDRGADPFDRAQRDPQRRAGRDGAVLDQRHFPANQDRGGDAGPGRFRSHYPARAGGEPFRIAEVTAFFLRDLQPPEQVVQAINNKIAQEQQIETERHRVEVARLQSDQQRLLNQTLTAEALTKQYLEVLHDMKSSNNLVVLVPTEGGLPLLDIAKLKSNLKQ